MQILKRLLADRAEPEEPSSERRPSPRPRYHFPVRVQVSQAGCPSFQTFGASLNLTVTGARLAVDRKIIRGARCKIHFLHAAGRVLPNPVAATARNVTRSGQGDEKRYEVGVEFDAPLAVLKRPGKM